MPPTTPPAMAPVLDLEPGDGFELEVGDAAADEAEAIAELAAIVPMADVGVATPLVKGALLALLGLANAS